MSDWDPELYHRFRRYREEPVTMMLERLSPGADERAIDLGCGTGEYTVELARGGGSALGIDSSPAMIERALALREGLEPGLRERVRFELADFRTLAAELEYTLVFSNAALQWSGDHRGLLSAAFRALRPGGRLAVQVPANENETAQATMREMADDKAWNDLLGGARSPSDENVLPAGVYRAMLAEIGFVEVDCFYHTFRHGMRNPGEVVEFCRSTSLRRFLDPLPPARQPEFIADFTRRLEESYGTRGSLVFNFRRLFMWARRGGNPPKRQT
ncbi:MAG TPA: methyltransferase domain-containing protein [Candidatus Binataceae bacterium]|nr:methyltransferase domain-containing protein [Candidatus Binataceae bacterium]